MPTFIRSSAEHETSVNLDLVKNIRWETQDGKPVIVFVFEPSFIIEWVYISQEHYENDVKRIQDNFFI
jgi:hypothetical protein